MLLDIDMLGHLVLMTADAVVENVLEAKKQGAAMVLAKPVRKEQVLKIVLAGKGVVRRVG